MSAGGDTRDYSERVEEFYAVRRGAQAGMRVRHAYDIFFEGSLPPNIRGRMPAVRVQELRPGCIKLRHFSLSGPITSERDFRDAVARRLPGVTIRKLIKAVHRHTGEVQSFASPTSQWDGEDASPQSRAG